MIPSILRITIDQDFDVTNPTEEDCSWTIYTFGDNDIITDCHRDHLFDDDDKPIDPELAKKLANGFAFGINYQDHGGRHSTFKIGDDTTDGLIVWKNDEDAIGGKTVEARRKDAESFLKKYMEWVNGSCYFLLVERIKSVAPDFNPEDNTFNGAFWEQVENCGGFIGTTGIKERIEEIKEDYPDSKVIPKGDSAWIIS